MADIAVVGAGLLGRLLAWQLLEQGNKVTLYDKDTGHGEQSAGIVAAAMLAPVTEVADAEPVIYQKGLYGFAHWDKWRQQLLATTGIDIAYQQQGSVVLAHRQDVGDYQHFINTLAGIDVLANDSVKPLTNMQLQALEPSLAGFDHACFLPEEGSLDNTALFKALAQRINDLNATWHRESEVADIDIEQFKHFDHVLDCRGIGAVSASAISGSLRGVRGEVIKVHAPEVDISRPVRLMHPRYKLYIAPKPNGYFVIGATQIESSDEQAITVRSSLELLSALYSVHKGFSEAHIVEQWARCRPALTDNLPRVIQSDNCIIVNGMFRHGYLLSPIVAAQTLQILAGETANIWPEIVNKH